MLDLTQKTALLRQIDALCAARGEIDCAVLAAAEGISPAEAQRRIDALERDGLISVMEYGFSCSVETMVEGLTEQGRALLAG